MCREEANEDEIQKIKWPSREGHFLLASYRLSADYRRYIAAFLYIHAAVAVGWQHKPGVDMNKVTQQRQQQVEEKKKDTTTCRGYNTIYVVAYMLYHHYYILL